MRAFIFDTETTGLIENHTRRLDMQAEIIEFYGASVDLSTGEISNEIDTLIKPNRTIPKEIIDITRITNEMVADAPQWKDVMEEIVFMIEAAPLCLGHNVAFDKEMVDIECERWKQTVNWPLVLCTIEQTMHLNGYRLSLTNLHRLLFDEPFPGAHRAKIDTQAHIRCCVELYRRGVL